MRRFIAYTLAGASLCLWSGGDASGRGFGGFHGGGFHYGGGGFHYGGYSGGFRAGDFGSYSHARSFGGYSGFRSGGFAGDYNRSWTGDRGGSIDVSGARGAAYGPLGGRVFGGEREVTATGAGGRSVTAERRGGVAVGPYGRVVGGASGGVVARGDAGGVGRGWQTAFARGRFPTDMGLAHYSAFGAVGAAHSTAFWSHSYMTTRAGFIRTGFGYYNCFRPGWYGAHPGCWLAAGWLAGAAWATPTWAFVNNYLGFGSVPYTYDYGDDVVYQNNAVYVGGQSAGTPEQYAQQATTLAEAGQTAKAPKDADWQALGVYALVSGDEKTSNNIFQLAVNKAGIFRGNYYDGLMDTTTEVYGSVDKKTQRAAWTIGKKKDRVFEAGVYNLTQSEAPVLVHLGTDKTQQLLLVRMEQPKDGK